MLRGGDKNIAWHKLPFRLRLHFRKTPFTFTNKYCHFKPVSTDARINAFDLCRHSIMAVSELFITTLYAIFFPLMVEKCCHSQVRATLFFSTLSACLWARKLYAQQTALKYSPVPVLPRVANHYIRPDHDMVIDFQINTWCA